MNALPTASRVRGAAQRQAWLFEFMRGLDASDLSESERQTCWAWAEAWSLCLSDQPADQASRYPYAWVLRGVRHPALGGCR